MNMMTWMNQLKIDQEKDNMILKKVFEQSLENDPNNINYDKYWIDAYASLYKDSNGSFRVKVNILNTNYDNVLDSCDIVVSNRGGYAIHLYNPTA